MVKSPRLPVNFFTDICVRDRWICGDCVFNDRNAQGFEETLTCANYHHWLSLMNADDDLKVGAGMLDLVGEEWETNFFLCMGNENCRWY